MTRILPCARCGKPCVWESTGLKPPTCPCCEVTHSGQSDLIPTLILTAIFIGALVWLALL